MQLFLDFIINVLTFYCFYFNKNLISDVTVVIIFLALSQRLLYILGTVFVAYLQNVIYFTMGALSIFYPF